MDGCDPADIRGDVPALWPPRVGGGRLVQLLAGAGSVSLTLCRQGGGAPARGQYAPGPVYPTSASPRGFTAFLRATPRSTMPYAAVSGKVVVTVANRDRVEGTFRYIGTRYSARDLRGTPGQPSYRFIREPRSACSAGRDCWLAPRRAPIGRARVAMNSRAREQW